VTTKNIKNNIDMKIGIIGGSGLEKLRLDDKSKEIQIDNTPYGKPGSTIINSTIGNHQVFIISRHGKEHTIPPTQVNNRAHIHALKTLGVDYIIATTACGSLRQGMAIGDLVVPDQFIDFTKHRNATFYDQFQPGDLKHTAMADPFDEKLRNHLISVLVKNKITHHREGTIITIEGPRFSTRAESFMFKSWGADLINMSIAPEAILANEAGIPYAVLAIVTDYDSWKSDNTAVTWQEVLKVFGERTTLVRKLLIDAIKSW
jgi:5'-methylthioadenosine phosphorylase